ncbi:hypothetical protein HGRIS_010876 [Hohenbuehelia grisea]|uniref:Polyketide synthase n=1 Tax=Hohenbuehelia grisea TaxID=104357 RepID=A0ABR3IY51_9AGAR
MAATSNITSGILTQLDVPVFAGQGTTAANSPKTRGQAQRDAATPNGSLLLAACFEAFHQEISSLSEEELAQTDIDIADFKTHESFLAVPSERYQSNPIITGTTLFLIQSLRYIAFIEALGVSTDSLTPFSDVLKRNLEHGLGVLGFSSGILPACVVGTSFSAITFLTHAVEAYRLAFWIGVRTQSYRSANVGEGASLPWSLVFMGLGKKTAEEAIANFRKENDVPFLFVTAIMDEKSVTISGPPTALAAFADSISGGPVVHKTNIDTLYHAAVHAGGARAQVLADISRRKIKFPTLSDVKVPIRSTFTGELLSKSTTGSLVEHVVDMILTQPVNWDLVIDSLVKAAPADAVVRLLNVGPGAGLTRSMERSFVRERACSVDISSINEAAPAEQTESKQEPIAIVGMAVNMPGARDAAQLWQVLEQGINTISEVPELRFKISDYNNPKNPNAKRQMKAHTGNFIDGADEFDNKFFKISPREAKSMDPQQRVLLHTAYEALEHSGYVPNSTPTSSPDDFGCYIGVATHDYIQNLRDEIDVYYSTGTLKAFLSGRISYAMQLSGPSIVVDTACSSSAVAVYQGCRALMNGDCNAAMVGGINVIASPDMMIGLDRGHFLSPTGQCKAFDDSADGYSRSEGCGIFVLKRLSDAIAEDDNILGVIRGIEVNQSGLAHSITHPHAPTQATLFKQVLARSGLDSRRVSVVEAHGTGTQAGDPNELESIRSIFAQNRSPTNPLHITSIKANIGHLEAASGAAGLAKLLLMLKNRTIPKQISLKNLNPKIANLASDHTVIDTEHTPWVPGSDASTRIALLNNFGAAGSNTAMLLEEFINSKASIEVPEGLPFVFGLSAKTEDALATLRNKYVDWLQSPESADVRFSDIAYTMTARRQIYNHRIAVTASSRPELIEKLQKAAGVPIVDSRAQSVFVFSGQGSQYLGMGQSLYQSTPLFKQHIDQCHGILTASGFPGVLPIINPGAEGSGLTQLEEFEANQAAIFSVEYALAQLWISFGVSPAAVVGHSLGEYAALVIANVLSLKGALLIVASRVRFMVQKCAVESTGMIAVNLGSESVSRALASSSSFADLSIACYNSETDCVLSGPIEKLKEFKAHLDAEVHCKNVLLTVPFGYHSSAMEPLLQDLILVAKHATIRAPTIPVISNVLGEMVLPGDASVFTPEYFARHCAQPVQFEKGIRSLLSNPAFGKVDAWIEIGPHTSTLPMLKSISAVPQGSPLLATLRKQQDGWSTITNSLAQLFLSNVPVHWRGTFAHLPAVTCADLPAYPLARNKFWVAFKESEAAPALAAPPVDASQPSNLVTEFSMLNAWVQYPSLENGHVAKFETPISQLAGSITGHSVGGMPLCPASVYLEQVFAGIELSKRHLGYEFPNHNPKLRKIEFAMPLVYDENVPRIVIASITMNDGFGSFAVSSRIGATDEAVHVRGEFQFQASERTVAKFARRQPIVERQMAAVSHPHGEELPQKFSTRTAYEVIFPRVVDYAKEYRTMRSLIVTPSVMEGHADVKLPKDYDRGKYVAHPVFMDTLLHVAGFVANMHGEVDDAYICSQVGTVSVVPTLLDYDATYAVYCNNAWLEDEGVMLAEAYAVQVGEPRRIVAHLKGMQFRRVRLSSLKKALARAAGKTLSAPAAKASPPKVTIRTETRTASPPVSAPSHAQSAASSSSVDTQSEIIKIVSETCDVSNIDVNTDLGSLGVDSLMSIEIFGKLEATFPGADLDANALSSCQSVADIVKEVSSKLGSVQLASSPSSPRTQPVSGASTPRTQAFSGASTPRTLVFSGASTPRTLIDEDKLPEPTVLVVDGSIDVKQLLANVLDISVKEIGDDSDFESLGLDSLTSIEALHALKNEFGLDLPSDFFTVCPNARSVQAYLSLHLRAKAKIEAAVAPKTIDSHLKAKVAEVAQTNLSRIAKALRLDIVPVPIQQSKTTTNLPVFLIHDGSGLVNYYERLSPLNRNIWGIHNPHFVTAQPWDNVVHMATAYADYIQSTSKGPVIVGGWSFGGVAAYEASLQLQKRGVQVKGVLLIDSPSPINHVPLSDALIDSVVNLDARAAASDLGRLVKTQFEMNSRMLGRYDPYATGGACPPLAMLRSSEGYNPPGVADVPIWLADRSDPKLASAGWQSLTATPIRIFDIPGNHFQPFHQSNIGGVSTQIAAGCEHIESL